MLPRSQRLTRKGFENTGGLLRKSSPHFSVSYGVTDERGGSAVIVPKKVVKGAVERHLLKRRMRAVLRTWSARNQILILSARKGSDILSFEEIENELSSLFASIIKR